MTRLLSILVTAALISACGGGGALPGMPTSSQGIAGAWRGTITLTKPSPQTLATTWTFTPMALTSGLGYEVAASWPGVTTRAMTGAVIGSQFSASGVYPSPLGCDGSVGSYGTTDSHTIDATFEGGSSCDSVFEGHMRLTR